MFGVLARATILIAVAPPAPVAWWPGARTLPESVLRWLPRIAQSGSVIRMLPSGARVVAIPVDGGRPVPARRAAAPVGPVLAAAPWGEPPVPFAGVTVSTCQVPLHWLGSGSGVAEVIAMPIVRGAAAETPPPLSQATITQFPRRPQPGHTPIAPRRSRGHFRRMVTLALGLIVSLVALEAAARSSRR